MTTRVGFAVRGNLSTLAIYATVGLAFSFAICTPAFATTKGLNQIVTPDIQPQGTLSISFQQQDPSIGNRNEFQGELGITKDFEVAVFEGTSPAGQIGNAELGLYDKGSYLLSTGFLNWTTLGTAPQPFLEGGFYQGNGELILGGINVIDQDSGAGGSVRNVHSTQVLIGAAYHVTPRLEFMADHQGGAGNATTLGVTYSITPNLTINPALYVGNSSPTKGYGFVVLTWTIQAFAPSASNSGASVAPPPANPTASPQASANKPASST